MKRTLQKILAGSLIVASGCTVKIFEIPVLEIPPRIVLGNKLIGSMDIGAGYEKKVPAKFMGEYELRFAYKEDLNNPHRNEYTLLITQRKDGKAVRFVQYTDKELDGLVNDWHIHSTSNYEEDVDGIDEISYFGPETGGAWKNNKELNFLYRHILEKKVLPKVCEAFNEWKKNRNR